MKIKAEILWRITVFLSFLGVIYDILYVSFLREPYGSIRIVGFPVYIGLVAIWGLLWCITPSKWWDWK